MRELSREKKVEGSAKQTSLSEFTSDKIDNDNKIFLTQRRRLNKQNKTIVGIPHPFLKWAGGKRQLIMQIDRYIPEHFQTYLEPFVGGGSVFFYLLPEKAIVMDTNEELINCYVVIQKQVEELILSLTKHRNEKEYFYKIRNIDRNPEALGKWSDVERASRTIYLNRCCFNGLYRVNSKGQFNVPFGKYKNPKFCDEKNLRAVNRALQNVEINNASFETSLNFAEEGDFLYLDPPYQPLSDTAHFTSYTKEGFGKEEQLKLFEVVRELADRGCKVMISNSYTKFILDLYKKFKIITVKAKRAINRDGTKRGEIKESLILNY